MVALPEARERIKIPDGVTVTVKGATIAVKGPKGELSRAADHPAVRVEVEGGEVVVRAEMPRRSEKAAVGTFAAHVRNLIVGVQTPYEYKLKTVFSHFPIKAQVKGDTFVIENFLGERSARKARILPGVKVDVKAEFVTVTGIDLEKVSQTAANIESATKIKDRDIRVFQDGIYIIQKAA